MVAISNNRRRNAGLISPQRLITLMTAVMAAVMVFYTFFVGSMLNKQQLSQRIPSAPADKSNGAEVATIVEEETGPPVVIAHAISLIKCGKKGSVTGFLDSAAVLRHSIHKNSIHATKEGQPKKSRYSYQMYAIVHLSCEEHAKSLERLGYKTIVKDHPVVKDEIEGEWLRNHIEAENCCGSAEFIKLYAYHLTDHPIVVHWDMDVAILQPMDDLFDAMLYPATHPRGKAAREKVERQHPEDEWPETLNAFFTRDITSAKPWEKITAVQGGFLVARPDKDVFDNYIEFIKKGNYVKGRGDGSGWGGLGYGGFQGAMAYQGAVAYFYDQLAPNTSVELNICRWNQVAADVIWRGPERMTEHNMQCRQYPRKKLPSGEPDYESNKDCEDCRLTPVEAVKTVHYTACKKPWECKVPHPRVPRDKRHIYRLHNLVSVDNCSKLLKEWFKLRQEFEEALETASDGQIKPSERIGAYYKENFLGYCKGENGGNYIPMVPPTEDFDIKKIYGM